MDKMKSIIEIVSGQMRTSLEGELYRAVQQVGVNVDKERLLQALKDARVFWYEGYDAGRREGPEWISVEDRLPEESTEVLSFFCVRKIDGTWERYTATAIRLCDAKWLVADYQNGIEAYSWGADIEDCCFRVTHWMPLPEAPEEGV